MREDMIFHEASKNCREWLENQPFVKEESLTDWLLYTISMRNPNIYYKAFSRNEEAFNGSDWEWWFIVDSKSEVKFYRLLTQAKKLKGNSDNYSLITYSNKNGLQLDLLIQEAKRRNAFPLYSYYSHYKPNIKNQIANIDYVDDEYLEWCSECENGCFLTSAFSLKEKVFSVPRGKFTEEELVDASFGLSILDIAFYGTKELDNILSKLNSEFLKFNEDGQGVSHGIVYKYDELPSYVNILVKRQFPKALSWYEEEFRSSLYNLSGLIIVDARKHKNSP